jgi:hypothetical protein
MVVCGMDLVLSRLIGILIRRVMSSGFVFGEFYRNSIRDLCQVERGSRGDGIIQRERIGNDAARAHGLGLGVHLSLSDERDHQFYARIVGLMYPLSIAVLLAPMFMLSGITVPGDFQQTATSVGAQEQTYRLVLAVRIVGSMGILVLAWAFYALVKSVSPNLAMFALLWRVFEVALGNTQTMMRFSALENYTAAPDAVDSDVRQAMHGLIFASDAGALHIAAVFFSVGSAIYFYLLFKSRFLPRPWCAFCIVASLVVTGFGFAHVIVPDLASSFGIWEWTPGLIAEVGTGLWLLIGGANLKYWREARPAELTS